MKFTNRAASIVPHPLSQVESPTNVTRIPVVRMSTTGLHLSAVRHALRALPHVEMRRYSVS
jgi:hypothetical protein